MPGNKKRSRKPGTSRVHSFTTKGTLPILFRTSDDETRVLKLMAHSDLAEIREGRGTLEHWDCLVSRLNWSSVLASMVEFNPSPAETINAGLSALMSLHARGKDSGKFVMTGDELRAVGEALTLGDDMHDVTTRRQHRDALLKVVAERTRLSK